MHGGHMKFGGSINSAQWTVGGDWLACIAIHFLVSCLCWPSLWCERHRCELLLFFLLKLDSLDGWLMQIWPSPDHSFYVVPPLLVNQTSELDFWYNLEAFVSGLSCSCYLGMGMVISWQNLSDLLQRIFFKQVYLPFILSFLLPLAEMGSKEVKDLRTIIKRRHWQDSGGTHL